ncbi:hypothetical protein P154DRAFT_71255 [Amniculicola lignicola CBS 123094]|uniref:Uncharacterized protein n=1 Tax=Amniculicola lignicola CBS 123094 TaxID=1392246 RepID=A0A6A5VVB1_9PLEO|nr:hypothetical protein P154DRAFT_71255 [Amniculicola lignicola CBS 123094]
MSPRPSDSNPTCGGVLWGRAEHQLPGSETEPLPRDEAPGSPDPSRRTPHSPPEERVKGERDEPNHYVTLAPDWQSDFLQQTATVAAYFLVLQKEHRIFIGIGSEFRCVCV